MTLDTFGYCNKTDKNAKKKTLTGTQRIEKKASVKWSRQIGTPAK